ncbi:MAG TPA: APC family permease [Candidatus Angelobacter sp.]|nr:APC family permease [Candidatus Angelobacter sp.]
MQKSGLASGRKLTLVPLIAATCFMVSGGPYGLEELVQTSGYGAAVTILILLPLVWALPTGLMVGELAAAIPSEGGFYVWVRRAMGPFWGFQEAWLSLMASIFDMGAYPTVAVLYLGQVWPQLTAGYRGTLIAGGIILVCMLWNLFGAKVVGNSSVLLGLLLLSPFAVITVYALLHRWLMPAASPAALTAPPAARHDLLAAILVAMWNYMGWDNASTVAEEVDDPQRTYPRVMIISLLLIIFIYAVPVLAVWSAHLPVSAWSTGSWAGIAGTVAGRGLALAVVAGALVSTAGILNSLTMSYSRLPLAMAEDGWLPQVFARKLKSGAPWFSIVVCAAAWSMSLALSFDRLIMLDILLYGASLVLEFVALAMLRVREPNMPRPFRVPGGLPTAILLGVGPTALLVVALIKNRDEHIGQISTLTLGLAMAAMGVVIYFITVAMRKPDAQAATAD